ncbi:hypothetical protein ABZ832_08270 [Streptantibioticus parmotrematis]|uniref:hypothetical protein n=1 Tax=Streptantibioticus parmotrematis TaxID=2873249 RepID=UPI0033F04BA7
MRRMPVLAVSGAVALAGLCVGVGTGQAPALFRLLSHEHEASYTTGAQALRQDSADTPRWLPTDARNVRIKSKEAPQRPLHLETRPAQTLMRFDLSGGRLPATCRPNAPHGAPDALSARWWPKSEARHATYSCAGWRVAFDGHTGYAWHPRSDAA